MKKFSYISLILLALPLVPAVQTAMADDAPLYQKAAVCKVTKGLEGQEPKFEEFALWTADPEFKKSGPGLLSVVAENVHVLNMKFEFAMPTPIEVKDKEVRVNLGDEKKPVYLKFNADELAKTFDGAAAPAKGVLESPEPGVAPADLECVLATRLPAGILGAAPAAQESEAAQPKAVEAPQPAPASQAAAPSAAPAPAVQPAH